MMMKKKKNKKKEAPPSPFLTTSDIIRHLNKSLSETPAMEPVAQVQPQMAGGNDDDDDDDDLCEDEDDLSDDKERIGVENSSIDLLNERQTSETVAMTSMTPKFELQRRLPDGSTRAVTESEQLAADLESKLQQVAAQVSQLPYRHQWDWIFSQKNHGNQLFAAHEYAQAIDVYLTCLMMAKNLQQVVVTTTMQQGEPASLSSQNEQGGSVGNDEQDENNAKTKKESEEEKKENAEFVASYKIEDYHKLFLMLMNNMAQSALHLSWYQKAIQFCNLALQELHPTKEIMDDNKQNEEHNNDIRSVNGKSAVMTDGNVRLHFLFGKLYFKRAKAHRLRGQYTLAKADLDQAKQYMLLEQQLTPPQPRKEQRPHEQVAGALKEIGREQQLIERNIAEGRKNSKRQQRAMQHLLGGGGGGHKKTAVENGTARNFGETDKASLNTKQNLPIHENSGKSNAPSSSYSYDSRRRALYEEEEEGPVDGSATTRKRASHNRAFSSIRAPPKQAPSSSPISMDHEDEEDDEDFVTHPKLSYWQWYWAVIGRVAEELLVWMGDEEIVQRRHLERQQQRRNNDERDLKND